MKTDQYLYRTILVIVLSLIVITFSYINFFKPFTEHFYVVDLDRTRPTDGTGRRATAAMASTSARVVGVGVGVVGGGARAERTRPRSRSRSHRARASSSSSELPEGDDASRTASAVSAHHWSVKLKSPSSSSSSSSSSSTHDSSRFNFGHITGTTDVLRDGDNATLVSDFDLVATFVARELGSADEDAKTLINRACVLLPPLRSRLKTAGAPLVAEFCRDVERLARRLRDLRVVFPTCDVATMVCQTPRLALSDDLDELAASLDELRKLFPKAGKDGLPDVDRMCQAVPKLLDYEFTSKAIDALAASGLGYETREAAADAIHRAPSLALRVESAHLRSSYSVNFDQAHVKAGRVRDASDVKSEAYYDGRRDPELPYW